MSLPPPDAQGYRTAVWQFPHGNETCRFEMALEIADATQKHILGFYEAGNLYEPDISRLMIAVLKKGDVVFDVGANCGYFTLLAGALVGPRGKVLAIEPTADCLTHLEGNIARNRLTNVIVLDRVAANRTGEMKFYLNSDNSGGHALWDPGEWPSNQRSRDHPIIQSKIATTLDTEWQQRGLPIPKLLKIDTEGAEQSVLEGAKAMLAGCKVPFVVAELHEFGMAKLGFSQESLRGTMEALGYSTFGLYFSGAMPKFVPPGAQIRSPFLINILFSTPAAIAEYWPIAALDPRSPL